MNVEVGAAVEYEGGPFWVVKAPYVDQDGSEVVMIEEDNEDERGRMLVQVRDLDETNMDLTDLLMTVASDTLSELANALEDPSVDDRYKQLDARYAFLQGQIYS